ncbi:hypothetical protein D9619_002323 [Psilocybe cf. subviscida]|uniref:Uncharacterized protein n=1 Tax=Psilocybe cf. subviscida TaxID=2480587 RepID=A0A8H5AWV7_9AGAR|nr:hypothetical protein D9619_002323 [Psilocybe cf. subviscida]
MAIVSDICIDVVMLGGISTRVTHLITLSLYIKNEIRVLGSVFFSIINAICTLSTYALYFIAALKSTTSWLQAVVQILLLVLPDVVGITRNVGRLVSCLKEDKRGGPGEAITRRSMARNPQALSMNVSSV